VEAANDRQRRGCGSRTAVPGRSLALAAGDPAFGCAR
jgi:hypothetical protein